jgi:acetyl-CoA carboxylase carboxyl transferase subunit beta
MSWREKLTSLLGGERSSVSGRGKTRFGARRGREKTKAPQNDRKYLQEHGSCPECHRKLDPGALSAAAYVCGGCGHHFALTVAERVETVADRGSFSELWERLHSADPLEFPGYAEKLNKAAESSGFGEAAVTGTCTIEGLPAALGVMSFAFMGGSMGVVVGEKVARLLRMGAERGLPVVLFASSGGARMQEGIFSLMQMAKTSHAAALLEEAGQPLVTVLTHPTTGGVTASFAMLGNVILAEPGALIGFAGPRVIESTIKQKLPEGFQRAEFQLEKGFVDAVVPRRELRDSLAFLLTAHGAGEYGTAGAARARGKGGR